MPKELSKEDELKRYKVGEPHVKVTSDNDVLWKGYPDMPWGRIEPTRGNTGWGANLGMVFVHDVCNGFVDFRGTSVLHKTFTCRQCGLRVAVPKHVETWAQLREHFSCYVQHPVTV